MRDAPKPQVVDDYCRRIASSLSRLYDPETRRASAYAWSHSGLAQLAQPSLESGRAGWEPDGEGGTVAVNPVERHARQLHRTAGAAADIELAAQLLERAERRLSRGGAGVEKGATQKPDGVVTRAELAQLRKKQREREMAGGGYGES